jgi:hypothetical protein
MYSIDIDFDEASRVWRRNKVVKASWGQQRGSFIYCCGFIKPNGKPCKAPPKHWCKSLRLQSNFTRDWGLCKYHCYT